MTQAEQHSSDVAALKRELRRWRLGAMATGCALLALVGVGMAQPGGGPTPVGLGVSDQPSGRLDDTLYRLLSDGTVEHLDTTGAKARWVSLDERMPISR